MSLLRFLETSPFLSAVYTRASLAAVCRAWQCGRRAAFPKVTTLPTPSVRHSGTQHGKQRVGGYLVRQKESTQAGNSTNKSFFIDDQLRPLRGRCTKRNLSPPARPPKVPERIRGPHVHGLSVDFPLTTQPAGAVGRSHNDDDSNTILIESFRTDFVDRKNLSARIARMHE